MAKTTRREIVVFADWHQLGETQRMGVLTADMLRGKEVFSFQYDAHWLKTTNSYSLDPDLQFYRGNQYLNDTSKSNFGLFLDSSPDRWGRVLMRRREAVLAKMEGRSEQNLYETDYLLGVFDGHRMGGLRFKTDENGPFLNDNKEMASPPWASIRELEQISLRLEEDDVSEDPEYLKWLNMLVAPGSSLGGARPKASIVDENNGLWIAKFPSKHDYADVGGWEKVTHTLALKAGLNLAEAKAQKFSNRHHTFLTKRFDRTPDGKRVHFASAMTLLGYTDGQDHADGISYLELVEFISRAGANVEEDLHELWRRIVFSICVSNIDDHLRNHGFVLTNSGWRLSPAFDINPVETGTGLKLNITENNNALDLDLPMEVLPYFRLSPTKAKAMVNEVKSAVATWDTEAKKMGIPNVEIALKARAFQFSK